MSVEKQSGINKNPGGMAYKILIFDVPSRWDSRPSWPCDCYRHVIPPGFLTVMVGIVFATNMPSLRDF
jgi:hypothetical protein